MEGLFWITVFGIGLVVGGTVIMKKVQLDDWMIAGFLFLSFLALLTYYGLGFWQIRRLTKSLESTRNELEAAEQGKLTSHGMLAKPQPAASVTENSTRTLTPLVRNHLPDDVA